MPVYLKVKSYIDEKGYKQTAIAKKANLSVSTFSAMMHGKRIMHADDLRAICCVLNVSPETFIDVAPVDTLFSTVNEQKEAKP